MLGWYKKFCSGVYFILKEKAKSDIPWFATFMFTIFLFELFVFSIDSLLYLLFGTTNNIGDYLLYGLLFIFGLSSYMLVFKNDKFLKYYQRKFSTPKVIALVLLILGGGVTLILFAWAKK